MRALQLKITDFSNKGATLLAVSPMLKSITSAFIQKVGLTFPVLCDTDNIIAKQYGLVFTLADTLRPIYTGFGIDLEKANGNNTHQLPLPATYLINQNGIIQYSFIDVDHTTRLDPEQIVIELGKL